MTDSLTRYAHTHTRVHSHALRTHTCTHTSIHVRAYTRTRAYAHVHTCRHMHAGPRHIHFHPCRRRRRSTPRVARSRTTWSTSRILRAPRAPKAPRRRSRRYTASKVALPDWHASTTHPPCVHHAFAGVLSTRLIYTGSADAGPSHFQVSNENKDNIAAKLLQARFLSDM